MAKTRPVDSTRLNPAYGSDRNRLVCGFLFQGRQAGQPVTLNSALAFLARHDPAGSGFIWLHFNLADASSEAWMRQHLSLAPEYF